MRERIQAPLWLLCSLLAVAGCASAQSAVRVDPPKSIWLTRPYRERYVPPINLTNTDRLQALIRAGNLYLSAQDVIALTLENNIDIEIQRYNPLLNKEVTLRTEGGGLLRPVGTTVTAGAQSVSLAGVTLNASGAGSTATSSTSGSVLTQLGPTPPSFDPQVVLYANFQHASIPESNTILSGTTALIQDTRTYQGQYSQYTDFGLYGQLTYTSQRFKYNSSFYGVNPFDSANLDLYVSQNLLYGFGRSVLGRDIRISKANEKISDLQFKQQVITTVSANLNLYWDLVSFNEDLKARKDELATAQSLYEDNKKQVQIGTLAPIEVTRAEAQVYSSQQDLLISQTNLLQQETVLKNALSRSGVATSVLSDVHIVPLDTIQIPEKDETRPNEELVNEALRNRTEIATDRINIDATKVSLVGIRNGLRPTLQVFAELTNNGLSGSPNYLVPGSPGIPFLNGAYGNLLGQIFQRNYPNYSAGLSLSIPLRNRVAQADYATSVLQLRQSELQLQKALNQVRVDVQNAVIGLRQAKVRYDSSVRARILQQQTLDAEKKKYTLGASTVFNVVTDQQALATSESTETEALANYSHARISFDQALGTTLDVNHVSVGEATSGHVARISGLPAILPTPAPEQKQ